eukprot:1444043-Karenia_brevis.AAC.1
MILTSFFDQVNAYGLAQWAFRKKHSCRDLVCLLVSRWLWMLDQGFKIAIYLSDISGAFDKVDRNIMAQRLRTVGVSESMLDLLLAYLAPRQAIVVAHGHNSDPYIISNQ